MNLKFIYIDTIVCFFPSGIKKNNELNSRVPSKMHEI